MDYGEEMDRDYGHGAYGGPRAMDSYMNQSYGMESHGGGGGGGGGARFGPYESYDSGSSLGGRDLYRSGYGYNEPEQSRFGGSYGGRFDSNYRNSLDSFGGRNQGGSSWEAPYSRSKLRPGFMEDRGRESYSSYSSFSSPHMKPAPVGSRGRGTPAYPDSGFGSRNYDAFGGPSTGRGRGRGYMGDFGGMHRPGIVVDYHNKPSNAAVAARGIKRKMIQQPYNKPGGTFIKKPKLTKPNVKMNQNKPKPWTPSKKATTEGNEAEAGGAITDEDFTQDACDGICQEFEGVKPEVKNEEEEKRRIEARREKQRRRREKNSEKYGDGYRMAFTCSFCKFRTFEEKDIEAHLESPVHQETLDHIQKQTKFDKVVMEFLHECMVNKFKKTAMRKQQTTSQMEAAQMTEKDVMEGVTADDHMMKVETVLCSACSVYVPALHSSVQQHLKSPEHAKGKTTYKEQIKRESVLTATSILNNPIVKARYERYVKGENPFEVTDQTPEQQAEEDKADEPVEEEEEEAEAEEEEEAETAEQTDFTLDQTEDA
ncbi:DBIRD complex subunit ZNF326 isoform X7 [Podarcis muralis]|uniref:DBIRD complex subunit ZNF326 n=3 Tax=Podarcis TaxID=42163 RepID=A0A670II28_PODMU|nr:DBIRD complex subunit ZNF326 isoform X1 [Podarcis muralis]XP_053247799.1 DBIRD complex subunit ZNF326 isoform X1 [Podarcis raffonei]CAI5776769.1 DBIRD complex subunit ZNF326 isoform X1 [Podarcis lilfordi]